MGAGASFRRCRGSASRILPQRVRHAGYGRQLLGLRRSAARGESVCLQRHTRSYGVADHHAARLRVSYAECRKVLEQGVRLPQRIRQHRTQVRLRPLGRGAGGQARGAVQSGRLHPRPEVPDTTSAFVRDTSHAGRRNPHLPEFRRHKSALPPRQACSKHIRGGATSRYEARNFI